MRTILNFDTLPHPVTGAIRWHYLQTSFVGFICRLYLLDFLDGNIFPTDE